MKGQSGYSSVIYTVVLWHVCVCLSFVRLRCSKTCGTLEEPVPNTWQIPVLEFVNLFEVRSDVRMADGDSFVKQCSVRAGLVSVGHN